MSKFFNYGIVILKILKLTKNKQVIIYISALGIPGSTVCCYDVFSISFTDDEVGVWFLQKTDIEKNIVVLSCQVYRNERLYRQFSNIQTKDEKYYKFCFFVQFLDVAPTFRLYKLTRLKRNSNLLIKTISPSFQRHLRDILTMK